MRGMKQGILFVTAVGAVGLAADCWAQAADPIASLQEVVVTAQKVTQREIDVPVAVTAVQGAALASQDLVQLTDYYSRIPGLQIGGVPGGADGISAISLRGITSGESGNPTIAVLIDDVPFGATTYEGQPPFPDLDPAILDRVEVLRGPQGTLYGASSLGGLIKFVTKTPQLDKYTANVELGPSTVSGGSTGWSGRGSANIPLISDHVALLVSGVYRNDPEWIANAFNNTRNVNQVITREGNAKLLIQPTANLSVTLSALAEHQTTVDDTGVMVCPQCATDPSSAVNYTPIYGKNTISETTTPGFKTFELYSARITYNLGWAQVTSLSAWNHTQWLADEDVTFVFSFLPPLYNLPNGRVTIGNQNQSSRFTQEVRLGSSGKYFDWMAGFYFNHELEDIAQTLNLFSAGGVAEGQPYNGVGPFYYNERAFFGDLTYHIMPKLDLQVGGRFSWLDEAYYTNTTIVGNAAEVFGPSSITPNATANARPVTWLVTPSYHINSDLMGYFRAANGYRPGGPNSPLPGIPPTYAPDKVYDYEFGLKGYMGPQHEFKFDAAVFQIDWKNLQLLDTNPISQFTYFSNGSAARSRGLELSGDWAPWRGLTVSPTFTYTDAELTQSLPPATPTVIPLAGAAGDELPYTSKYAGNLALQQSFAVTANITGFVGADYNYVGSRLSSFRTNSASAPGPRFTLPGYGLLELDAGLSWNDNWRLNLYARNVGNVEGVVAANSRNGTAQPVAYFTQPRTMGFDVEYNFEHR
jgi:iron complex outermembrane recepter protein